MDRDTVIKEARSWRGTKWMHHVALKGYGVDCVQFIVAVFQVCGYLPKSYKTIIYDRNYALRNTESILERELNKYCYRVSKDELLPGDIITYKFARCATHAALYTGNNMIIHVHLKNGVEEVRFSTIEERLENIWRMKEDG